MVGVYVQVPFSTWFGAVSVSGNLTGDRVFETDELDPQGWAWAFSVLHAPGS